MAAVRAGVDVGPGHGGVRRGHEVGVGLVSPPAPAPLHERLPVAGRQGRVGQQHGVAPGHQQPGVPPPVPAVPGGERAAVDPDQQRRRVGLRGVGRQHQPASGPECRRPAVAVISSTRPGTSRGRPGCRDRPWLLVGGRGVEGDGLGRRGHGVAEGVERGAVGGRAQVGEGAGGADSRVTCPRGDVDPEGGRPPVLVGDEVHRRGCRAPIPGSCGQRSSSGGEVTALAAGQVDEPQRRSCAAWSGSPMISADADRRAGRRASTDVPVGDVAGRPSGARRSPVATSIATRLVARSVAPPAGVPAGDHGRAVGGDVEARPSSRCWPVPSSTRSGLGPARRRRAGPARGTAAVPRTEVVVPVPDRIGLEQLGGDPGLLAGLVLARVLLEGRRCRGDAATPRTRSSARRGRRAMPSTPAGGSASRRASPPPAGRSHSARPVVALVGAGGLGLGVGAGRGEQHRPVGEEGGVGLALGRAGQPPGRPPRPPGRAATGPTGTSCRRAPPWPPT